MNTRDQIFSGTKEVDQKLSINQLNLEKYLKNIFGDKKFRRKVPSVYTPYIYSIVYTAR